MAMQFDAHGNRLSPAQLRARAMAQGKIKPKPKPSGRLVISGSRMEDKEYPKTLKKAQYKSQMQSDMREFLTCANSSYPDLALVYGDASGVDQTGASIFEQLGGSVINVPHDSFRSPLDRNTSMLDGGYEEEDSDIGQKSFTGFWARHDWPSRGYEQGQKIRGRKQAPSGTSPKGVFLAFWSHEDDGVSLKDKTSRSSVDSTGTWDTVKKGNQMLGRDSVCDVWKAGAAECCEQLGRILG